MGVRVIAAYVVGLLVAVAVAFGVNALAYGSPAGGYGSMQSLRGSWGVISGLAAGAACAVAVLAIRLSDPSRRSVWLGVSFISLVAALVLTYWVAGFVGWPSISSLEGAWTYPLMVALWGHGGFAIGKARRNPRSQRQSPTRKGQTEF